MNEIKVELIAYSLYADLPDEWWRPIGLAEIKVIHKLSEFVVNWHYSRSDANDDLSPNISRYNTGIHFEMDYISKTYELLELLITYGLVTASFEFEVVRLEYDYRAIIPWDWDGTKSESLESVLEGKSLKELDQIAFELSLEFCNFLSDIYYELGLFNQLFSRKWYVHRCVTVFFDKLNNRCLGEDQTACAAFQLGYLYADAGWKFGYETEIIRRAAQTVMAGQGGGAASRSKKLLNLSSLMNEVERLKIRNPDMSEDVIFNAAILKLQKAQPDFPKSAKTHEEYKTLIRSESPYKEKYKALFY